MSRGLIDRLKPMPITRAAVLAGRTGADLVRNALVVTVMIAVGYLVGQRPGRSPLAVLVLMVWGLVFSWVGAFLGLALRSPEAAQAASFPLIFPLVASSIFVLVESMPGWLQAFVEVNPITLVTDTVRALALGEPFELFPDLAWAALWMVVILAVFVPLAIARYRRG